MATTILHLNVNARSVAFTPAARTFTTPNTTRPVRPPRPAGPRVFCDTCDEYPEGFRGKHELSRHQTLKHDIQVWKYICLDPGPGATVAGKPIVVPFHQCKRCLKHKQYNSEQNAIDHLRRGHFIPKWHPNLRDEDRVHARQLPAKQMRRWVQKVVVDNPPQPTADNPGTTPESTTGSSEQGSSSLGVAEEDEATMGQPGFGGDSFIPGNAPFALGNDIFIPTTMPESTTSSSRQGLGSLVVAEEDEATMGQPGFGGDSFIPENAPFALGNDIFIPENAPFVLGNDIFIPGEGTIDPALLTLH
ncbi:hypothetical protein CCMA1212_006421 [Trichoderma ghanense]|uniref:DUF7896 domain-containing protein n=1 Tax=Trichoderma ghanense TaxID=65468 RepID=A0ABY2H206_9HYPO